MTITQLSRLLWIVLIAAISVLIFLVRLNGPTDLESYGQPTNIGYLLDLMAQGHFLVQHDLSGAMMSVPPLHTWLAVPFAAIFGFNRLALTLPSFLSVLAMSLLVFETGRRRFGELAGGLAAMALLLSPTLAKHIALAGSDPVFALTVSTAALAASSAWPNNGSAKRNGLIFWLMGALATLTMGPLGIILASGGLISHFWGARNNPEQLAASRPHLTGLALFLGVVLAWFIPAGLSQGFWPTTRMLMMEAGGGQASELLKPITSLLIRYLPFSLFLFSAVWRVFRRPAADAGELHFERFLACWLIFGFLAVSLTEQRGTDPLLPLWPACALLAGREMARLAERMGKTRFAGMAVVIGCILIGATYNAVHSTNAASLGASAFGKELRLAGDAELAANALKASNIDIRTLNHLNTPRTLQLYLGTFSPLIDRMRLEEILARANGPVDLAMGNTDIEELGVLERYPETKSVFRWPADKSLPAVVQVYRIAR